MPKRLETGKLELKRKKRSYRAIERVGFNLLTLEIISRGSLSVWSMPGSPPGIDYILHKHHRMDEGIDE